MSSDVREVTESLENELCYIMGGSPGGANEELVAQEKRKKGWRMSCDVCEATEGWRMSFDVGKATEWLENEL